MNMKMNKEVETNKKDSFVYMTRETYEQMKSDMNKLREMLSYLVILHTEEENLKKHHRAYLHVRDDINLVCMQAFGNKDLIMDVENCRYDVLSCDDICSICEGCCEEFCCGCEEEDMDADDPEDSRMYSAESLCQMFLMGWNTAEIVMSGQMK